MANDRMFMFVSNPMRLGTVHVDKARNYAGSDVTHLDITFVDQYGNGSGSIKMPIDLAESMAFQIQSLVQEHMLELADGLTEAGVS